MLIMGLVTLFTLMLNVEQDTFVINGLHFGVSTMVLAGGLVVVGFQLIYFWLVTRHLASIRNLIPPSKLVTNIRSVATLERQLIFGAVFFSGGVIAIIFATLDWQSNQYGADGTDYFIFVVPAISAILSGLQIMFGAFLIFMIDD